MAREGGCNWDTVPCFWAATRGAPGCILKWALENGAPCNEFACHSAARNGQLEVLKFWMKNGFSVTKSIYSAAASSGHIEVIKWARGKVSLGSATFRKHLEVICGRERMYALVRELIMVSCNVL